MARRPAFTAFSRPGHRDADRHKHTQQAPSSGLISWPCLGSLTQCLWHLLPVGVSPKAWTRQVYRQARQAYRWLSLARKAKAKAERGPPSPIPYPRSAHRPPIHPRTRPRYPPSSCRVGDQRDLAGTDAGAGTGNRHRLSWAQAQTAQRDVDSGHAIQSRPNPALANFPPPAHALSALMCVCLLSWMGDGGWG